LAGLAKARNFVFFGVCIGAKIIHRLATANGSGNAYLIKNGLLSVNAESLLEIIVHIGGFNSWNKHVFSLVSIAAIIPGTGFFFSNLVVVSHTGKLKNAIAASVIKLPKIRKEAQKVKVPVVHLAGEKAFSGD
jgi:hypothetical protein